MFRGYEPDRDRLVAIKLFRLDLPPERVQQFVAELDRLIAAGLTRPGIAAPLATGIDRNTAFLVQEFFAADSLDVLVRDYGPAPPANAVQVAVQLAGALDFAAVVNVSHGALHPRDVLLSTDESRMTGLGLTRALERVGVTAPVRRPYTAPERIAGAAWDRRADIFSLAAIVHEMLWGRRVQGTGSHAVAALTEVAGGDLGLLRAAFARALAEKPADRFETALEFAAALKHAFPDVAKLDSQHSKVDSRQSTGDGQQSTRAYRPAADDRVAAAVIPARVPADFELRAGEDLRYQDVEAGPAIIAPGVVPALPRPSSGLLNLHEARDAESALERSRSAMWPLALALIVGLALGFSAGYGIGNRERTIASTAPPPRTPPVDSQPSTAAVQTVPTTGREFTESPVADAPKPAPPNPAAAPGAGSRSVEPASAVRLKSDTPVGSATSGSATVAAETGRLLVRSTPAGARVFVDGRDRGPTPATIRGLPRGAHRVRVVHDGYTTEERRVVFSGSRLAQSISVALTRARAEPAARTPAPAARTPAPLFSGSLSVDSLPPGAKVFVDGKLIGVAPVLLPQIGAGAHVVRLEHDGYRKWSSSVRVVAGERNRVTASLEK